MIMPAAAAGVQNQADPSGSRGDRALATLTGEVVGNQSQQPLQISR